MCACFFPGVIEERVHAFMYKTTCVCVCVCVHVCACVSVCMLRLGGEKVMQWMVDLACITWEEEEEVPDNWVKQLTVPMHKKESVKVCGTIKEQYTAQSARKSALSCDSNEIG